MDSLNMLCLVTITGVLLVYGLEHMGGGERDAVQNPEAKPSREGGPERATRRNPQAGAASKKAGAGAPASRQAALTGTAWRRAVYFLALYGLIAIRCVGFGQIPGGFNQDGAMSAVDALALADYGTDRFGTWLPAHFQAWGYGQMSVLLAYLTVPFIKLWGLTHVTARLPILLASLLGAAALYGLVKEMISEKAALIVLLFTAVNPWHFMQSRWALDCNMFPHMFVAGLYFLVKGMKKARYYYLSMFFFALCMYSYGVAFYMVPVFLLAACGLLLRKRKITWGRAAACAGVYFGISFPICGTMLINFMKWDTVRLPFTTMPYFPGSVRSSDILFFSENIGRQLTSNFHSLWRVAFLQKPDLIWNAIDDFGTMYKCSLPLILLGIVLTVRLALKGNEKERLVSALVLLYWVCSVLTGLFINSVNVNRINIIFYGHILFAGVAVYYVVRRWRRLIPLFLVVYSLQSVLFFNRYFTVWADQMEDIFYADFLDAVEYAGSLSCDYYYITPDTQYTGSSNVSEILTLFALEVDARYFQGNTDSFRGAPIPYRERFCYRNPAPEEIRTDRWTAYVVRTDALNSLGGLADLSQFWIRQFDSYCVAVPRQYVNW